MIVVCKTVRHAPAGNDFTVHDCSRCNLQVFVHDWAAGLELVCTECWPSIPNTTAVSNEARYHYLHEHDWTDVMIERSLDRQTRRLKAPWN